MILENKISMTADQNKVIYSKIIEGKILTVKKEVKNAEKALFWAKMYGTMADSEWKELNSMSEAD